MANGDPAQKIAIDFVDPLFAVALHVGLSHGILEEPWFKNWEWPGPGDLFSLGVFFLGFLTLLLSWLGYHQSIIGRPLLGAGRFYLDVIVVILYAVILVKHNDLNAVLELLFFVYAIFILWDFFKRQEHATASSIDRDYITMLWCAFFGLLWALSRSGWGRPGYLLACAIGGTVLYRVNKANAIWRPLWKITVGHLIRRSA